MSFNSNPGNASASSGVVHKSQLFTANGTWNKPAKFIEGTGRVTGISGGGSGACAGASISAGGDGGEYVYRAVVDVSAVGSVSVTIGSGGASVSVSGTAGNNGGSTSFGSILTLRGGQGGGISASADISGNRTGGAMGGQSNGTNVQGDGQSNPCPVGGTGGLARDASANMNGGGGGLVLDDSGTKGGEVAGTSTAYGGWGYGAGGAASRANGIASGAGADGALLVEWQEYA